MRHAVICSLMAALFSPGAAAADDSHLYNTYKGQTPPELLSAPSHWVNRDEGITLAALRGQLVWLQFNF